MIVQTPSEIVSIMVNEEDHSSGATGLMPTLPEEIDKVDDQIESVLSTPSLRGSGT